ncbi:hypothetical protein SMC26_02985 [Actinomadura fulvescens]|uniref:Integral membrane protein n=1 Tax=Actinomadura fulvescens TaxID=46160 RepID=A0ABP6C5W3_9ACTN
MEALRIALLVCHLAVLAILLGAFVARLVTARAATGVMAGAAGGLLGTGILLIAVRAADDLGTNGPKVGVKLAVAVAVFGCALAAYRRAGGLVPASQRNAAQRIAVRESAAATGTGLVYTTGVLAIVNAAVAVAWN